MWIVTSVSYQLYDDVIGIESMDSYNKLTSETPAMGRCLETLTLSGGYRASEPSLVVFGMWTNVLILDKPILSWEDNESIWCLFEFECVSSENAITTQNIFLLAEKEKKKMRVSLLILTV